MPSTLAAPVEPTAHLRASVLEDARLSALIDTLHRDGIHVSVTREVHEWDAATATVTSHILCLVDGRQTEGVGVARDRVSASMLAIRAAITRF
jgi:hypothetical protein